MDPQTGDTCEATGVYETACRCKRLTLVVAGKVFPHCGGCKDGVRWLFLYEEFIGPRFGPRRATTRISNPTKRRDQR